MKQRSVRAVLSGFVVGLLFIGGAVAGTLVGPLGGDPPTPSAELPDPDAIRRAAGPVGVEGAGDTELDPDEIVRVADTEVSAPDGTRLPDGSFLVGAARASLHPTPEAFGGERWQTEGCTAYLDGQVDGDHLLPPADDAVDELRSWPASSPDCVYLGGFDIGPVRPATGVGQGGVWVRALAISNGERTFVYGVADTVGWFARYDATICEDCGILDVRERLAADLDADVADVVIGSTHTHAGADTYGGWGGIPDWYRSQIRDATVAAAKQAVANLEPATLRVGEAHLRDGNSERRDTYYSTADTGATWLQATGLPDCPGQGGNTKGNCETSVIATLATYAAHPTIVGGLELHADWPGATARRFEERYGGVGVVFEGGLGNVSVSGAAGEGEQGEAEATGRVIADGIADDIEVPTEPLASNAMAASVRDVVHPTTTNPGLTTLATVGLFDREFTPGTPGAGAPGVYRWSKAEALSGGDEPQPGAARGCTSAGPTVITSAGAHRIGDLLVAFAPGEIFSNIAEVVKERADRNDVAMVLGQTNDALGYIIQSFEYDTQGGAATEYGTQTGEYEETFSIDRCFGDHVLEALLESTGTLGFGS